MPQPDPYPPRAVGHQPVAQVASPPVRARGALVLSAVPHQNHHGRQRPRGVVAVDKGRLPDSRTRVASCPTTS
jgi:hypothetical protein